MFDGRSGVAPAGWYPDPNDARQWRYWGGEAWTDHFAPREQLQAAAVTPRAVATASVLKLRGVMGKRARRGQDVNTTPIPSKPKPREQAHPRHGLVAPDEGTGRRGSGAAWMRRHKLISALAALLVLSWTMDAVAGDDRPPAGSSEGDANKPDGSGLGAEAEADTSAEDQGDARAEKEQEGQAGSKPKASASRKPKPKVSTAKSTASAKPKTRRATEPQMFLVTRVVDGDTIELGNGAGVRIVGIDTPEEGSCGYDAAAANMERLVLGKRVRLTVSDEDQDRYGRWLRYVDVGAMDAGLRQIKRGFAIARYDSRDGYGFHVREPRYIAADGASRRGFSCPKPVPTPVQGSSGGRGGACTPGYSPCVPPSPTDLDCADVDGPIRVTGSDPHGFDADGDGIACE